MKVKIWNAVLVAVLFSFVSAYGDYMNITVDGDFSDWAGVSTLSTDVADNPGSIDYATLQVANDENFFYFRYTLHAAIDPNGTGSGTFLAIDEDNNTATGYDIFGLGLVGSEAGWQNDFPFEQATGVYNTGNGLTGATYAAAPYAASTISVEVSIPRSATHTSGGGGIFPADGQTIGVMVWNQEGAGDTIVGNYTFSAAVPEPGSMVLLVVGMGSLLGLRRFL